MSEINDWKEVPVINNQVDDWQEIPTQQTPEPSKVGKIEAAARGATQGLTLGTGEEIGAGLFSILDAARRKLGIETEEEKVNRQLQEQGFKGDIPTIEQKDILSQYRQMRDVSRAADVKAKEDQIEAYTGGELVGSLAPVLGTGGAAALAKGGVKAATFAGGKAGGIYGGLGGLGTSEADVTKGEVGELAKDVAIGTGTGAIAGGLMGATPAVLKSGINKVKDIVKNTEDIGKRVIDNLDMGLKGISTTGNKRRIEIDQGLADETKFLKEAVDTHAMSEAKDMMGKSLLGESRDITKAVDNAITKLDEKLKITPDDPALNAQRNILVQEKEKLIQLPDDYTRTLPTKSQAMKDMNVRFDRLLKGDEFKNALNNAEIINKLFDTAAKLKKGSKINSLELTELNMNIPKIADDLGLAPADAMNIARDIARLNITVPKYKTRIKQMGTQQVQTTELVDEPKQLIAVLKKYIKPELDDSEFGKLMIRRGGKILKEVEYRPDDAPIKVVKSPSEIFELMKSLRDKTASSPDKMTRKIGKEIDDIFDAELKQGMTDEQLKLFNASKDIYRTKYDIEEALGDKVFNAPKGSTAEKMGWSDLRKAMEPLEDVSVTNQGRELAEDIFSKIGKITKQPDLLPRLKEQVTLANLAEGQSGLVPTKASYLAIGAEKIANIAGRGINYATKGNKLVKMDSAGLKALASRTKSSSPELSNFLESLSNVENHTRRNALLFAASQKAGLKEELEKYFKDEEP